jgi:RNA polymerase sigma factor (sigma-70 family)
VRTLGPAHAESAKDIGQEVFLQLARAPLFERFENGKRLRAYLATVTRNRAYDYLRREGRITPTAAMDELTELAIEAEAADAYASNALLGAIRAILSATDRDLLDRLLLGYSAPEVASQLEISDVAARVRIHRLRARIQTYIEERGS